MFAYGFLAVVLALYLTAIGLDDKRAGLLLSLTLGGDMAMSLALTTSADRVGRRRILVVGAVLMFFAAGVFAGTDNFWLLGLAAILGVISPTGNEVGPFLPIEQAALSQLVPGSSRTRILAWYNLTGSVATAFGSLLGGGIVQLLQGRGWNEAASYRPLLFGYGATGIFLALGFAGLSAAVEAARRDRASGPRSLLGLHKSRGVVLRLSALFALDSFGGGFVIQSIVALWFHERFGTPPAVIGSIYFGANILAGLSGLAATRVACWIGLVKTMVFTHMPSNVLLILVPLMPSETWAIIILLLRFSISQMDVPTRQSYTMAVVAPGERSAAAGITDFARSLGPILPPMLAATFISRPEWIALPFVLAGSIKLIYDLLLWRSFSAVRPPEE
jgi:MFS family permease